ncbi:phage DNA ejection protein [Rosenbergiella nectarea]|uniref:phage DNA ejection protein n=1 Tax=Rosenbergiella nectarea TaxID=988801 RepID=UPI001BDAD3D5|nr:phage DNA ejection protein [Rosenbergiella nectarea]MBT0729512.1 phage DNA ejection protein [Rosenbergiella nectarea subsp. apis]
MPIQPIDYSSGNSGFLQGLQTASDYKQLQQQTQQQERQNQFYTAMQNTPADKLSSLRTQFPEYADNIQKEIGIQDSEHAAFVNKSLNNLSVAYATNDPQHIAAAIQSSAPALQSIGVSPDEAIQTYQQNPQHFGALLNAARLATMPIDKQFDTQQSQQKIDETNRSNLATEGLTARGQDMTAATARRGQDITMRGQDIGAATTRRGQDMAMQRSTLANGQNGDRTVQLADGRTVSVSGKLHGSGENAFYDGMDDNGNFIRVPAGTIAAPAGGATNAGIQASNSDISTVLNAYDKDPDSLGFATGITGGVGTPAKGADYISRYNGKEQRQLFTALQRIQGRMQNQGISAAKEMGASGINTKEEAQMFFKSMPQVDYSSPASAYQSVKDIDNYTKNYNQQYNVNVGGRGKTQQSQAPAPSGTFTSSSGIKFKVTP